MDTIYVDGLRSKDAYKYEEWLLEEGYEVYSKLEPYGRFQTLVIDRVGLSEDDRFYLLDLLKMMEEDGAEIFYA